MLWTARHNDDSRKKFYLEGMDDEKRQNIFDALKKHSLILKIVLKKLISFFLIKALSPI